ncbi:hypothetical protein BHM03_00016918 [Ensete ventricosum]|nr:hypothetical protein BHM03_00016918 [Ensete ventricosum]
MPGLRGPSDYSQEPPRHPSLKVNSKVFNSGLEAAQAQCRCNLTGNRRTAMSKTRKVKGVGWDVSAIGNEDDGSRKRRKKARRKKKERQRRKRRKKRKRWRSWRKKKYKQ